MLALGLALFALGTYLSRTAKMSEMPKLAWEERALIAARAFWFYGFQYLWPMRVMLIPRRWDPYAASIAMWLALLSLLATMAALLFTTRKLGRGPLTALLWFGVLLFPTIGLVPYSYQLLSFVANRYGYMPDLALSAVSGALLYGLLARSGTKAQIALGALCAAVIIGLGFVSYRQTEHLKNAITTLERDVQIDSKSWAANCQLGLALSHDGRPGEAIPYFEHAIQLFPEASISYSGLGHAHLRLGKIEQAVAAYAMALTKDPTSPAANFNLGSVLVDHGNRQMGIKLLEKAVQLEPQNSDTHLNYGSALAADGQSTEALFQLNEAIRLNPGNALAIDNRNRLLKRM